MFPINFNFPYRKKDGSVITMEKALDGAGADLDLIDLDDVSITTPADGDGLVYDSTSQKWENKQITTKEQWQKNGAYNIAPNDVTTQTIANGGITVTRNSDGTLTLNGTNSTGSLVGLVIHTFTSSEWAYFVGKTLKLRGLLSRTDTFLDLSYSGGTYADCYGDDSYTVFTATSSVPELGLYIRNGETFNNEIVKPMITTDLNATYADYVPYAKTNRELTELADGISTTGATPNSTYVNTNDGYSFTIGKWGHFAILHAQFKTTSSVALNTEVTVATIPSGYRPKISMAYSTHDTGDSSTTERHDVNLLNEKINLTLRNQHDNGRWVSFTIPYICE